MMYISPKKLKFEDFFSQYQDNLRYKLADGKLTVVHQGYQPQGRFVNCVAGASQCKQIHQNPYLSLRMKCSRQRLQELRNVRPWRSRRVAIVKYNCCDCFASLRSLPFGNARGERNDKLFLHIWDAPSCFDQKSTLRHKIYHVVWGTVNTSTKRIASFCIGYFHNFGINSTDTSTSRHTQLTLDKTSHYPHHSIVRNR